MAKSSRSTWERKAGIDIPLFLLVLTLATLHSGCAGVASSGNPGGPTVSITSPISGATVSAATTVSANASSDAVGVQFKLDGANLGSEKTSAPFSFSWDTTTTANGAHTLTAVARNAAGRTATSAPVNTTVQNSGGGGPNISITAPSSNATVSGPTTVSASASSGVGISGVQFLLDGANLGAEVTTNPYSFTWDTTATSNGAHTLAARARDTAGATTTSISVTVTVSNGSSGSDFQTRCNAPGVVRCNGFDSATDLGSGGWGANFSPVPNAGGVAPTLDTTVKASGNSSLKFTIPPLSYENSSGDWFTNFSADLQTQFGPNTEFYVQWRQRFDPVMLTQNFGSNAGGWKQVNIGIGDQPGCITAAGDPPQFCTTSCNAFEVVINRNNNINGPFGYYQCGLFDHWGDWSGGPGIIRIQHSGPPYCTYGDVTLAGCFQYVANEWMTFQVHVKIGTWGIPSSRLQMWAARQGQPSVLVLDSDDGHGPDGYVLNNFFADSAHVLYGKVWLTTFNTGKDPTINHPETYTWFDELIISRQKISDPR